MFMVNKDYHKRCPLINAGSLTNAQTVKTHIKPYMYIQNHV